MHLATQMINRLQALHDKIYEKADPNFKKLTEEAISHITRRYSKERPTVKLLVDIIAYGDLLLTAAQRILKQSPTHENFFEVRALKIALQNGLKDIFNALSDNAKIQYAKHLVDASENAIQAEKPVSEIINTLHKSINELYRVHRSFPQNNCHMSALLLKTQEYLNKITQHHHKHPLSETYLKKTEHMVTLLARVEDRLNRQVTRQRFSDVTIIDDYSSQRKIGSNPQSQSDPTPYRSPQPKPSVPAIASTAALRVFNSPRTGAPEGPTIDEAIAAVMKESRGVKPSRSARK